MTTSSAKILVSTGDRIACIKISGRANFTSSIDFKTLLQELIQNGYTYFILDLTACLLMDSTFLGVLSGFGLKLNGPQPDQTARVLELYKPNPRILELLENLGVIHLFKISFDGVNVPADEECVERDLANPSREVVTRNCLEAHQLLMEIHPENVARFKDVAQFMAEDLKKLKSAS